MYVFNILCACDVECRFEIHVQNHIQSYHILSTSLCLGSIIHFLSIDFWAHAKWRSSEFTCAICKINCLPPKSVTRLDKLFHGFQQTEFFFKTLKLRSLSQIRWPEEDGPLFHFVIHWIPLHRSCLHLARQVSANERGALELERQRHLTCAQIGWNSKELHRFPMGCTVGMLPHPVFQWPEMYPTWLQQLPPVSHVLV